MILKFLMERMKYQKPNFPLITDGLYKDDIEKYWKGKPVTFAYMNNCVGCFHRNAVLLKHMSERHPNKFRGGITNIDNWADKDKIRWPNG